MTRFLVALLASASAIAGLTILAKYLQWIEKLPSFFYQIIFFLLFGTIVVFRYLYRVSKPDLFIQIYIGTIVLKFIAYGAFNLILILDDRKNAAGNVAFFMVLYVIFTILEIAFLFRKISRSEGL